MMKFPRNALCPCGSGRKFKRCHDGKPFDPLRDMNVRQRNMTLLAAAYDIFGFKKGRSWTDFKKNISSEEVRQFYQVQADLSAPQVDWASIVPKIDGKLCGLYLGDIRPELTLRNIIRFSLYSDQIFVINPFLNPHIIQPEYNPIENPNQYKADTLNLVHFLISVSPWIESGVPQLIPDPGDLNPKLKFETARLAAARIGDLEPDPLDLEEAIEHGRESHLRALFAMPDEDIFYQLERAGIGLTDEKKELFLEYARRKIRNDPVALEQQLATNRRDGQMVPIRAGTNLETALLICGHTGAFPYTNLATVWNQLVDVRDQLSETSLTWSPITKAFQALDFQFLNNVDPRFAQSIREDGRLESFRTLLRKIGSTADGMTSVSSLDAYVRDVKDELVDEYRKAQAEWSKINESFVKWVAGGASVAAGIVTGHLVPDVTAWTTGALNTVAQLGLRYMGQQRFRKTNPMSVFIDLSRKEPPGVKLY